MTDPKLQELTASEPLTYEQELEMQRQATEFPLPRLGPDTLIYLEKWREDEDSKYP